jgi:hypothetical protein
MTSPASVEITASRNESAQTQNAGASSGRESLSTFAELPLSLDEAVLAKASANELSAIIFPRRSSKTRRRLHERRRASSRRASEASRGSGRLRLFKPRRMAALLWRDDLAKPRILLRF